MCKVNFGTPALYINIANPGPLQTFPISDTLYYQTSIAQLSKLFSANGQCFLTPENQGNVRIFNLNGGTAFQTATYYTAGAPFRFYMQTVLPAAWPSRHVLQRLFWRAPTQWAATATPMPSQRSRLLQGVSA